MIVKRKPFKYIRVADVLLDDDVGEMILSVGASLKGDGVVQCMDEEIFESAKNIFDAAGIPMSIEDDYEEKRVELPLSFYRRMEDFNRAKAPLEYDHNQLMNESIMGDARRLWKWLSLASKEN